MSRRTERAGEGGVRRGEVEGGYRRLGFSGFSGADNSSGSSSALEVAVTRRWVRASVARAGGRRRRVGLVSRVTLSKEVVVVTPNFENFANRSGARQTRAAAGMRRPPRVAALALAACVLTCCCSLAGGSESDEDAAADALLRELESSPDDPASAWAPPRRWSLRDWPSDAPDGLGEDDPRVRRWQKSWRAAVEHAWSRAHSCPVPWEAIPESTRRILRVVDTSANYSGYNYPGSEGPEDRPYILPPAISPPPPPNPSPPPLPPAAPSPPPWPPPPPPYPVVRALAWRGVPTLADVDLFVSYAGVGPIFEDVDRYYYSLDPIAINATGFTDPATDPPYSSSAHSAMRNVPPNASFVYVRLADAAGTALGRAAAVVIETGSHFTDQLGNGFGTAARVRTLYELVAAMRDPKVERITLERHIGLAGAPLPPVAGGRHLTVVGACGHPAGPTGVNNTGTETVSAGGGRRRLQQVQFSSSYENKYHGTFADVSELDAIELLQKAMANMQAKADLGLSELLDGPSTNTWPQYPSDVGPGEFPWDHDAWETSVESVFRVGSRFDSTLPVEYHEAGAPLGGAAMNVSENIGGWTWVNTTTLVNVTNATTGLREEMNVTDSTLRPTFLVPLLNRCVVDGLERSRIFTVGDPDQRDCRWPEPRPRRFKPGYGGATPTVTDLGGGMETVVGAWSPWGNDNAATPRPRGPQTEEADPFTRTRGRRCGRLELQGLVLRRGWSEDEGGAAVRVIGGELRVTRCVVEGQRTGAAAGRGGAVANFGGGVEIFDSIFRHNVAARGKNGTDPTTVGRGPRGFGNHLYNYHSSSLYVDYSSTFDGKTQPATRISDETGV